MRVIGALANLKYELENNPNCKYDLEDLRLAESLVNSLEALKVKIDVDYDYHVVVLPSHKMKYFISYIEELEAKERKEQTNG